MVTRVGYSPLFAVLAVFDMIGAVVVWVLARKPDLVVDAVPVTPPLSTAPSGA
jgi:ACS family hexuronate transporter-like MFS transporter